MSPRRANEICSRPACARAAMSRSLCKQHYPIAYPAHLRGDVDATRAREHIASLRARGVTVGMLHDDWGMTDSVVYRIEKPGSKIRAFTEAHVLAIPLPDVWMPTLADVDAIGTHRRLQALAVIGYSQRDIASRIGTVQQRVAAIMRNPKVSSATAAKVAALFEQLQMTPGPSTTTRQHAHRRGLVPPFAWDEESIDDPAAKPYAEAPGHHGSIIEQYDELYELGYRDLDLIAERIGVQPKSIERALQRRRTAA